MLENLSQAYLGHKRMPLPRFGFEMIEAASPKNKVFNDVNTLALYDDLARSGMVVFRGFNDSLEDFNELVSAHSARITFDPARKGLTSNTAEIDAGKLEMGLHQENGNLPFTPDIQWFYCLVPAKKGSQTIMCDGHRVLHELSSFTRKSFEQRKIKYSRRIPWPNVKRFLSIELQVPLDDVTDSHLDQVNTMIKGQHYLRLDTNLIKSELIADAIITSHFSGKKAFCNSLLGPSVNYEPPVITWDDGEEIDFHIWDEIKDVTTTYTYDFFWNKGDIVVIDNNRVMHGRRRLADISRRIVGAQSYRKEDVV